MVANVVEDGTVP